MERDDKDVYIIYKSTNTKTGGVYIGATGHSIKRRKQNHYYKSQTGTGSKFHEGIATYGMNCFEWEVVDTAKTAEEMAFKEKQYIGNFDSLKNGYNSDCGGAFKKTVYQYDKNGSLINTFSSLSEAAKQVGVVKQAISKACLRRYGRCRGFYWGYEPCDSFVRSADNRCRKVHQYTLDEKFLEEYISVAEAARRTGFSQSGISRVCRGERSSYKGFNWSY